MFWLTLQFTVGVLLLTKSAEWFARAAAQLAELTRLPRLLMGAILIGLVSNLPEFAVSLSAIWHPDGAKPTMALGNAIGSNIANTGLILGVCLVQGRLMLESNWLHRQAVPMLLACLVLYGLVLFTDVTFSVGLLLVGLCLFYVWWSVSTVRADEEEGVRGRVGEGERSDAGTRGRGDAVKEAMVGDSVGEGVCASIPHPFASTRKDGAPADEEEGVRGRVGEGERSDAGTRGRGDAVKEAMVGDSVGEGVCASIPHPFASTRKDGAPGGDAVKEEEGGPAAERRAQWAIFAVLSVLSIPLVLISSRWVLHSAVEIARTLEVSETVIALTLVAAGTSLPELATALAAYRKGHADTSLGIILGSNIYNALGVIGVSGLFTRLPVSTANRLFDVPVMLLLFAILLTPVLLGRTPGRRTGYVLLGVYALYSYSMYTLYGIFT